jgi:hypothetical protein
MNRYKNNETLIPWMDVDVWSFRGRNAAELLAHGGDDHVLAMAEYRRTGGIVDCYLVKPNWGPDDDSGCWDGPLVDEIDWTGFSILTAAHESK